MSSVDSRVVQMEFDDSNFDSGVQRAIHSIKELDDELVLKNGTKGLDNIQKAAQSFDTSNAVNALENVAVKASDMASRTVQSFLSIAPGVNQTIQIVERLGGTIFNLMKEGGFTRALNIEQATWKMKNLGMDVKATQEDIDYAVSGTRFGFDEAANAAAQFGASGVKSGEQMKTALRGISGVATMTNSEYANIADVFTKIASNGHVMTMELRQISSRGLNAAKALADYFHTTEANIYELVTKGEIGFDDFAKAMDAAFGEASTKANETFSGALANMKAAVKRIGAEVAAPYIDNARQVFVKIIPLVNTINNTFKSFGKGAYKEIKKPSDYIKKQLDATGKYISKHGRTYEKQGKKYVEWVDSCYVKEPSKKLKKALENTNYYVDKYGDTYKKVVTKNGAVIRKYISGESLFGVIRNDIIKARKAIVWFLDELNNGGMDSAIYKYAYAASKMILGIRDLIIGIGHIVKPVGEVIVLALKPFVNADVILNMASAFKDSAAQFERFTKVAKIGEKTLIPIVGIISKGLTVGLQALSGVLSTVIGAISGLFKHTDHAEEVLSNLTEQQKKHLKSAGLYGAVVKTLNGDISKFSEKQKKVIASVGILGAVEEQLNKKSNKLIASLKTLFGLKPERFFRGFDNLRKAFDNVTGGFETFIDKVKANAKVIIEPWERLYNIFTGPLEKIWLKPIKDFRLIIQPLDALKDKLKSFQLINIGGGFENFTKKLLDLSIQLDQFLSSSDGVDGAFAKLVKLSEDLAASAFSKVRRALSFINPLLKMFVDTASMIKNVVIAPTVRAFQSIANAWKLFVTYMNSGKGLMESFTKFFTQIKRAKPFVEIKKAFEESDYINKMKNHIVELGEAYRQMIWQLTGINLGPVGKLLGDITKAIKEFVSLVSKGADPLETFKKKFSGFGLESKFAWEAFKQGSPAIQDVAARLLKVHKNFDDCSSIVKSKLAPQMSKLNETFDKSKNVFNGKAATSVNNLSAGFLKLSDASEKTNNSFSIFERINMDSLKSSLNEIGLSFKLFIATIGNGTSPIEAFKNLIGNLSLAISNIFKFGKSESSSGSSIIDGIVGKYENIKNANKSIDLFSTSIRKTGLIFSKQAKGTEKSGISLESVTKKLSEGFKNFEERVKSSGINATSVLDFLINSFRKFSGIVAFAVGIGLTAAVAKAVKNFLDFSKSMKKLSSAATDTVKSFQKIPEAFTGMKKALEKNVKYTAILKVAASVALLAGSLWLLASLDPASLAVGLVSLTVAMGVVLGFIAIMNKLNPKNLKETSTLLLSFAGSMAILVASLFALSQLSLEDLGRGLGVFLIFLTSLVAMLKIAGPAITNGGKSMLFFALAIGGMTTAMMVLALLPYSLMVSGLLKLMLMMAELAVFLGVLRVMKVETIALTLKKLGSTLRGMALALAIVAKIDPTRVTSALKALGGAMLELAVFIAALKVIQSVGIGSISSISSGILILSVALIGLSAALKIMSTIPADQLTIVIKAFAALMAIIVVAAAILSGVAKGFLLFASAMAILSIAMITTGASFFVIGAGLAFLLTTFATVGALVDQVAIPLLKLAGIGAAFIIGGAGFLILGVALIALGAGAVLAGAGIMLITAALAAFSAINIPNLIANMMMFVEGLKALAPEAGEAAGETVEAMSTSIKARSGHLGESAGVTILNFLNGLKAHGGDIAQTGVDLVMQLLDGLSVGVKNNGAKLGEVIINILQGLGQALVQVAESLLSFGRDIVGMILDGIASAIGLEIPQSVKDMVTGFTDGIGGAINDFLGIGKDMGDAVASGTEEGTENIKEKGEQIPKDVKEGIENGTEDAKSSAANLGEGVSNAAAESFDGDLVGGAVDGLVGNITSSLESGNADVTAVAREFGPSFSQGLGQGIDAGPLTAGLTTAIGGAVGKAKKEAGKAKNVGKEASKSAGKGASDNKSAAESGGKDIGQGLVNGIKSKTGAAGSAGYAIGAKALAEAKRAVKSKSPSKEFHKLGVNIDEGLILGIKSLMDQVGHSGRDLGKTAVSATEKSIKAMSFALDGIDTAPTIRPVVDLSGIQSGVDAANSIFAGQSALQAQMAVTPSRFYDPNGTAAQATSKQVNNTISITLDYKAGADATQITQDIAAGLMNLSFMEA